MQPRRWYFYVGPQTLKALLSGSSRRVCVRSRGDVVRWLRELQAITARRARIAVTFIIDVAGELWLADRHSEHLVCAGGEPVLTAGEMTFDVDGDHVEVVEVTNQSTGYCPEPDSWDVIASTLDRLDIQRPSSLTAAFIFRRCDGCGTTNLVKDEVFECGVCQSALSRVWNCDRATGPSGPL